MKASCEVIHKASDRYDAWIILSKSIVTRIMAGFELEIIIIILRNNDMIERNNYKKKMIEACPNYHLKVHYRAS